MSPTKPDSRNPFYILLIVSGFLFTLTALAYAVVPVLEEKAAEAGGPAPPSPFRASLREDGWMWLTGEAVAVVVFGLLSMALDRLRTLRNAPPAATIKPGNQPGEAAETT